ncbi:hypothetical protein PL11201_690174 [Planktothrix sp. PCC 11201]|uniref:hypothetical protein n=1 Tax=Planktothrix sp. PCC 11201 TaxID=1729650 RepID=UPI00091C6E06|nr:hypothetical protein [Planktothrix sp. PCC 11201]SKB15153.1 hypothetical protein PL11201_690174 [Planktothrix sp. PCC 11201]
MLTFLLSFVINGTVFLPEYSGIITHVGSHSIVKIANSSPSFIILSQVRKPSENDPIVPPN